MQLQTYYLNKTEYIYIYIYINFALLGTNSSYLLIPHIQF